MTAAPTIQATDTRRRAGLTWYSSLVALSAYAGAVGLAGGTIDTGTTINARLPFDSPVFAAIALALIVGVPNTAVAWYAWRGDHRARTATLVAGVLLIGWIAVEFAIIREFSWLQPFYVAVGASLVRISRRMT